MRRLLNSKYTLIVLHLALASGCGGTDSNPRALPSQPGPNAAATVQGVDTNSNGVRDEVELSISANTPDDLDFAKTMAVARAYQAVLTASNPPTRQDAIRLQRSVVCLSSTATGGSVYRETQEMDWVIGQVFDTPQRVQRLDAMLDQLNGGLDGEELSACS